MLAFVPSLVVLTLLRKCAQSRSSIRVISNNTFFSVSKLHHWWPEPGRLMLSHRCVCRYLEYNLLHEQVSPSFWCTQTTAAIWVPAHCQRFAAVWCTGERKCRLTTDAGHRAGVWVFGMQPSRPHKKGLKSVTALFHPAGSCPGTWAESQFSFLPFHLPCPSKWSGKGQGENIPLRIRTPLDYCCLCKLVADKLQQKQQGQKQSKSDCCHGSGALISWCIS